MDYIAFKHALRDKLPPEAISYVEAMAIYLDRNRITPSEEIVGMCIFGYEKSQQIFTKHQASLSLAKENRKRLPVSHGL